MKTLACIGGVLLVIIILWDAFETIILPRRISRRVRLTRMFFSATWYPYRALARRIKARKLRESTLGLFGPLSLLLLLAMWVGGLILGFALWQWGAETALDASDEAVSFLTYLYMSGVTFLTLGFGDVTPNDTFGRVLIVIEAGVGFGFLALIIGYLPVIYQSFSKREVCISLLDARAGSPPSASELVRRHAVGGNLAALDELLADWEKWSAELLESHLSYPVLAFFRSQHTNQSWLAALVTILDTCALLMANVRGYPAWQARLTFAMARHACVDLLQVYHGTPIEDEIDRLSPEDRRLMRERLIAAGIEFSGNVEAERELDKLRAMYEPYAKAIAKQFLLELPQWNPTPGKKDNWQTTPRRFSQVLEETTATTLVESKQDEHAW